MTEPTAADPRIAVLSAMAYPPYNETAESRCTPWDEAEQLLDAYRDAVLASSAAVVQLPPTNQAADELTAEEARDLADELGTELYRAQDALAFVEECCVIADREQRQVTTADVREWLKGARCGRQLLADAEDQPALRDRIAAAMREHYLCTNRDEADADGNLPCRCGDWREPGPMGSGEDDWDSHLADAVLPVLPAPVDRAAIERVRAVLETEAVVGRSALEYRGLITSALMAAAAPATEEQDGGPNTAETAAALGMTPTTYRAASHSAAMAQIRAAVQGLYVNVGLRVLAALDEEPGEQPAQPHNDETPDGPRTVCVCGHTKGEHGVVSGRLLCGECDPDSTDNLVCKEFEAL